MTSTPHTRPKIAGANRSRAYSAIDGQTIDWAIWKIAYAATAPA